MYYINNSNIQSEPACFLLEQTMVKSGFVWALFVYISVNVVDGEAKRLSLSETRLSLGFNGCISELQAAILEICARARPTRKGDTTKEKGRFFLQNLLGDVKNTLHVEQSFLKAHQLWPIADIALIKIIFCLYFTSYVIKYSWVYTNSQRSWNLFPSNYYQYG